MVLVIGGSGFIGPYLVEGLLENGYDVAVTGRNKAAEQYYNNLNIPFINLDIRDEDNFKKIPYKKIDSVIHLAALIPAANKALDAKAFLDVNALGTLNSLNYCKNNNIKKFLFTTSHFTVEDLWGIWDSQHLRIKEEMGRKFKYAGDHTTYIISKIAGEEYIEHFMREYGISCSVFRLSGVWGYGRYESGFEYFVNKAIQGEDIEVYGDPKKVRDNIYVKDVVRALIMALQNDTAQGLFNLSSGIPLTLMDEVENIVNVFSPAGKKSKIVAKPDHSGGIQKSYVYDVSRIKDTLGFKIKFPYKEMLLDYKSELDAERFSFLVNNKIKN